jgi:hypothetical protein
MRHAAILDRRRRKNANIAGAISAVRDGTCVSSVAECYCLSTLFSGESPAVGPVGGSLPVRVPVKGLHSSLATGFRDTTTLHNV